MKGAWTSPLPWDEYFQSRPSHWAHVEWVDHYIVINCRLSKVLTLKLIYRSLTSTSPYPTQRKQSNASAVPLRDHIRRIHLQPHGLSPAPLYLYPTLTRKVGSCAWHGGVAKRDIPFEDFMREGGDRRGGWEGEYSVRNVLRGCGNGGSKSKWRVQFGCHDVQSVSLSNIHHGIESPSSTPV